MNLRYFINKYPDDPIGIKKQIANLKNSKNTSLVEYPYSKEKLQNALEELDIKIDLEDICIKHRKTKFNIEDLNKYDSILQKIIKVYINYDYN